MMRKERIESSFWKCNPLRVPNVIPALCLALLVSAGCSDTSSNATSIASLEKKISKLDRKIFVRELLEDSSREIALDPAELGTFQKIETELGYFFVVLKAVTPYMDGYKINLWIGNPYAVKFIGFTLKVTTHKRVPKNLKGWDLNDWKQSERVKEHRSIKPLEPASWISVNVMVPSATAEDIGMINLEMIMENTRLNMSSPG